MTAVRQRWLLLGILLAGFGLRLFRLGQPSLWYDETVSVHLAGKSLPDLVAHTARDIHPPGYYALLHGWIGIAGSSDFAVSFLSLWFGVLLVALAYRLAARMWGRQAGLLAALLTAVSPFNLWYSQEVRMYTLGATLGMGVLIALVVLVQQEDRPQSTTQLAAYVLCAAAGLWVLYYFAFLLIAVNLMAAAWWATSRRRGRVDWGWIGRWAAAQGLVLLLYAPWLPVALRQATTPPVPPWRGTVPFGRVVSETWSALSLGQSARIAQVWPVLALFAVLFALALWPRTYGPGRTRRRDARRGKATSGGSAWLPAGYVFGPVVLIYLASFLTPLYHVRYAFTYSTPFYALIGLGLARLWRLWRPLGVLTLAVVLAFCGVSIRGYNADPQLASDDHRAATAFLAERWRPGDAILVDAGYVYTALETYWRGDPIVWRGRLVDAPPFATGATRAGVTIWEAGSVDGGPQLGWGDPESDFYALTRAQTEAALERMFSGYDRVWLYRCYDTVTDPGGYLRQWLAEHGALFEDQVFAGEAQLRVQGYLTDRDPLSDSVPFRGGRLLDGSLELLATLSVPSAAVVGSALDVGLVWQVGDAPHDERILFAGLFDEEGRRWAQTDVRPAGPLYPIGAWPAGSQMRTPLRMKVPPGTPPGQYRLEVGWYRFEAGLPVWLPWTGGDRVLLGLVSVAPPSEWRSLPAPPVQESIGASFGGVRLLGLRSGPLTLAAGETADWVLVWQALVDGPEPGPGVLLLVDEGGRVWSEQASGPVGGRLPFSSMQAWQTVVDYRQMFLPDDLLPGAYRLLAGRRNAEGEWLPARRARVSLGETVPLATLRVLERKAR